MLNATILVVEDEAIVARDLQRTLGDLGYQVLPTAASYDEAIARASERCPDLVLMDIRLQGQRDGIHAAEMLRQQFRVPVVFLTAYADDLTLERAKKAQPYGYLMKPIGGHELRSTVEVALYRHRIDMRLRERERWVSTTLRSIADTVVSVDAEGRVNFMNAAAEALTGWPAEEALGRSLADARELVDERTGEPVEPLLSRVLRDRRLVRIRDVAMVGRDGTRRPVEGVGAPIFDGDDLLGAVMVLRDVTEQRQLQRQIELADRLAALGTLAGGVVNEIGEPLTRLRANVRLAAEEVERHRAELQDLLSGEAYGSLFRRLESIQQVLAEADEGTARVRRIVTELRTLARSPDDDRRPVDLRRVLSWAGEVVAPEIRSRACLAMEIGKVPLVNADEARLGQVFVNLLLNAAHAIAPGDVDLNEVRITGGTAPDGRAFVEVRDTGCGIPRELLGRIFDPFYTTKPVGSGTGLGLAISHGIVRALEGEIQVDSTVGKGSVFRVLLPPAGDPSVQASGPVPSTTRDRKRVLVIDDDPLAGTTIRRALEPEHQLLTVKTVREASALIGRGEAVEVILCDLRLPEGSGMDFYDELLRMRPSLARRVIFLAGGALTPKAVEFIASVSNRVLTKPLEPEVVLVAVRQTLAAAITS